METWDLISTSNVETRILRIIKENFKSIIIQNGASVIFENEAVAKNGSAEYSIYFNYKKKPMEFTFGTINQIRRLRKEAQKQTLLFTREEKYFIDLCLTLNLIFFKTGPFQKSKSTVKLIDIFQKDISILNPSPLPKRLIDSIKENNKTATVYHYDFSEAIIVSVPISKETNINENNAQDLLKVGKLIEKAIEENIGEIIVSGEAMLETTFEFMKAQNIRD